MATDGSPGEHNVVFVTSTVHSGDLGGLAGADGICAARAIAGGIPGVYVAWLSTGTVDGRDRLGTAEGWVRIDGKPFARSRADLLAGRILYPVLLDEFGLEQVGQQVFSATSPGGTLLPGRDCSGWTTADPNAVVNGGSVSAGSGSWTYYWSGGCNLSSHLLCFGIDYVAPLSLNPRPGRRAFFAVSWTPGGGITSADATCQGLAATAGLGGTFKALLATTTASAISRFDTSGPPWVRLDEVSLADPAANLAASRIDAALNLTTTMFYVNGGGAFDLAWTGAGSATALGTPTSTCSDWNDASPSGTGQAGFPVVIGTPFFYWAPGAACSTPYGLYCLQE
jgi:hypothetical protein